MRCKYCRSITHETDCPKELADRFLPLYSTIHKLEMMETRAAQKQIPLYSMKEADVLLKEAKRVLADIVLAENAKSVPVQPVVAKNATVGKK